MYLFYIYYTFAFNQYVLVIVTGTGPLVSVLQSSSDQSKVVDRSMLIIVTDTGQSVLVIQSFGTGKFIILGHTVTGTGTSISMC